MRFHKTAALVLALLLAMVVLAPAIAQQNGQAEVMLQAAQNKQLVDGDLSQAIQMYKKILSEYSANRPVAAKALVEMGDCYEKLGKSEALKAYQRVLHDYADQSAEANEARARLAALERGGTHGSEMVAQRIWAAPDVDVEGGVAPSGRFLSYVDWDTGDLAVHDLVTGRNRRVTHKGTWSDSDEFAENSVPSPNGREIAYAWYNKGDFYELRVIDTNGSKQRVLFRNPQVGYLEPYSWSPDGKEIVGGFWQKKGDKAWIMEISVTDGSRRILKTFKPRPGEGTGAMYSPDGLFIAYDIPPSDSSPARDIYIVSKDGSNDTPLVQYPSDDYLLGWAPDGKSVIFASSRTGSYGVWQINVADGKPSGPPRLLKADMGHAWPMGLTRDGSLYYGIENWIDDEYVASFDFSSSKLLKAPAPVSKRFTGRSRGGAWSPDGKYLAYLSRRHMYNGVVQWNPDTIVIRSLETGQERMVIPKLGFIAPIAGISWSADGQSLYAAGGDGNGRKGIFTIDAKTGKASMLFKPSPDEPFVGAAAELPTGNSFIVRRPIGKTKTDRLVVYNPRSGQERVLFRIASPAWITGFSVSSDGRQVAFTTGDEPGGTSTLRVVPVAGGKARIFVQLKTPEVLGPSGSFAWTPDGRYIVFGKGSTLWSNHKNEFYEISTQGGQPRDLGLSMPIVRHFHVNRDGHRLLFESDGHSAEVWVIRNFLPTLKASR